MAALITTPLTMTSREISELTGKRHDNVMTACRKLADFYAETYSPEKSGQLVKPSTYTDSTGRELPCFDLDKQASLDLVTGYSLHHRHAVNVRWQELEALQRPSELSRMEILQLAMDSEQARIEAESKLALAGPKVVYADAMLNAEGTVLVRDAAKTIGVPVRKLEKALRDKGVILLCNSPAAKYVAQGYLIESLSYYDTNTRGRQISRTTRVTGKGLEFLRRFAQRHAGILAATTKKAAA